MFEKPCLSVPTLYYRAVLSENGDLCLICQSSNILEKQRVEKAQTVNYSKSGLQKKKLSLVLSMENLLRTENLKTYTHKHSYVSSSIVNNNLLSATNLAVQPDILRRELCTIQHRAPHTTTLNVLWIQKGYDTSFACKKGLLVEVVLHKLEDVLLWCRDCTSCISSSERKANTLCPLNDGFPAECIFGKVKGSILYIGKFTKERKYSLPFS